MRSGEVWKEWVGEGGARRKGVELRSGKQVFSKGERTWGEEKRIMLRMIDSRLCNMRRRFTIYSIQYNDWYHLILIAFLKISLAKKSLLIYLYYLYLNSKSCNQCYRSVSIFWQIPDLDPLKKKHWSLKSNPGSGKAAFIQDLKIGKNWKEGGGGKGWF